MAAYIEVATTQARSFTEALLILGAAGATMPKECGAFKGPMLRAKVFLEDDKGLKMTLCMRKIPAESKKKEEKAAPAEPVKLTKEAMEEMSLGELRKATGITQGGKEAIIKQYLGGPADAE